jgi:asparaginyl-tRNA synthetase
MDTNTLSPKVTAVTLSSTAIHAGNRNLSTDPKRMAVIKVWDSMMRGARKYCVEQGFVIIHNMPHIVRIICACENPDLVNHYNII